MDRALFSLVMIMPFYNFYRTLCLQLHRVQIIFIYIVKFRKYFKPFQIKAPQNRNPENPTLNRPSEYKTPGLVLGIYLRIQSKTKQNWQISFPLQASPIDFEKEISFRT